MRRVSKRSAPSPTKRTRNPIRGRRRMFGVGVVSAGSGKVLPLGGRRGAWRPEPPRRGAERDVALMAGISAGDPAALEALYERHAGAVFALCLRVLGDRSEAEEVLEDVFFELWQRSARFAAGRSTPPAHPTTPPPPPAPARRPPPPPPPTPPPPRGPSPRRARAPAGARARAAARPPAGVRAT